MDTITENYSSASAEITHERQDEYSPVLRVYVRTSPLTNASTIKDNHRNQYIKLNFMIETHIMNNPGFYHNGYFIFDEIVFYHDQGLVGDIINPDLRRLLDDMKTCDTLLATNVNRITRHDTDSPEFMELTEVLFSFDNSVMVCNHNAENTKMADHFIVPPFYIYHDDQWPELGEVASEGRGNAALSDVGRSGGQKEKSDKQKEISQRREYVYLMLARGDKQKSIADTLGVVEKTIRDDIAAMNDYKKDILERRKEVWKLVNSGCSHSEISTELGIGRSTVSSDLKVIRGAPQIKQI